MHGSKSGFNITNSQGTFSQVIKIYLPLFSGRNSDPANVAIGNGSDPPLDHPSLNSRCVQESAASSVGEPATSSIENPNERNPPNRNEGTTHCISNDRQTHIRDEMDAPGSNEEDSPIHSVQGYKLVINVRVTWTLFAAVYCSCLFPLEEVIVIGIDSNKFASLLQSKITHYTYIHRACTFWIICHDVSRHLVRYHPTESNNPTCSYLTVACHATNGPPTSGPPGPYTLR